MRGATYYVYIMSSLSRTLYAGVTNGLERRVLEHKEGKPGSFTARYKVNRLVYFEEFADITQAIAREKGIKKKMTRARKIKLIESINPQWKDPSEQWKEGIRDSPVARALREPGRGMTKWRPLRSALFGHSRRPIRHSRTGFTHRANGRGIPDPRFQWAQA